MRLLKVPIGAFHWNEETTNLFMVAMTEPDPKLGTAVVLSGGGVLVGSPEEAMNLAAWLLVMASDAVAGKSEERISKPEMEGMFLDLCDKIRGA